MEVIRTLLPQISLVVLVVVIAVGFVKKNQHRFFFDRCCIFAGTFGNGSGAAD